MTFFARPIFFSKIFSRVGAALGYGLGGVLGGSLGWRYAFLICGLTFWQEKIK